MRLKDADGMGNNVELIRLMSAVGSSIRFTYDTEFVLFLVVLKNSVLHMG